ncbi:MAG: hypothetical protein H8E47_03145 [Anaerolineales bacterium]|nr:hypothetical protein [Anaerolineales bacterium]
MDIEKANAEAVGRMMEAHPVLVGLGKAFDVIPGMRQNLLLYAGPPITLRGQPQGEAWQRASGLPVRVRTQTGPMRGAITGAPIFEGRACQSVGLLPD